jgi:hypothetical protein
MILKELEGIKRKLLEQKRAKWSLKSRPIWLAKGHENTRFFQNYAKHHKNINTIWEMRKKEGPMARTHSNC